MRSQRGVRSLPAGRVLWLLTLIGASGCGGLRQGGDACGSGEGLQAAPYLGAAAAQALSLTFDGGPTAATTSLGDVLAANSVQATFFVTGNRVADNIAVLERLKLQGHLVANGGFSGQRFGAAADPVSEVRKTDALISAYVSGGVWLLRAPDDDFSAALADRLNQAGLTRYVGPVGADVRPGCSEDATADACALATMAVIRAAGRGLLAWHVETPGLTDMLRLVLPKLREEQFTLPRLDLVPGLREALERSGAIPGTVGGPAGCNDYGN